MIKIPTGKQGQREIHSKKMINEDLERGTKWKPFQQKHRALIYTGRGGVALLFVLFRMNSFLFLLTFKVNLLHN